MNAKLAKVTVRGEFRWRVDEFIDGKRHRKLFPSKAKAQAYLDSQETEAIRSGAEWAALPPEDRAAVISVVHQTKRAGIDFKEIWSFYQAAASVESKTIQDTANEVVKAKIASGCRKTYTNSLRLALNSFTKGRELLPISKLTTKDISDFVNQKYSNQWSRRSILSHIRTLCSMANKWGLTKSNPALNIDTPKIDWKPPAILSPSQAKAIIEFTKTNHPEMIPWITATMFCGIRPFEADQLTWNDISIDGACITINAAISKIRSRRVVDVPPNAQSLLQSARSTGKLPTPHSTRRRFVRKLRLLCGFTSWPADILRHSCASYWIALSKDATRVAHELGNSPAILSRHYKELVSREDAVEFFNIS